MNQQEYKILRQRILEGITATWQAVIAEAKEKKLPIITEYEGKICRLSADELEQIYKKDSKE